MARYLIALGSSHVQGNNYIQIALNLINKNKYISIFGISRVYRNSSLGLVYNRLCYNAVAAVKAHMHPQVFYRELMHVEHTLGRIKTHRGSIKTKKQRSQRPLRRMFSPRTIDIDVLLSLDGEFSSPNFAVPHYQAFDRKFFVIPAIEALKLAQWPLPFRMIKARVKFGHGCLYPDPS